MILIEGKKYACQACIRGHRASSCNHTGRELTEIRPKGRPVSQCEKCRYLRKERKAHVKCLCSRLETKPGPPKSRRLNGHELPRSYISSIENLLNPCNCSGEKFCTCCRPKFSEYLRNKYPSAIVEETAVALNQKTPSSKILISTAPTTRKPVPDCPSGPDAPCCAPRPLHAYNDKVGAGQSPNSSNGSVTATSTPPLSATTSATYMNDDDIGMPAPKPTTTHESLDREAAGRVATSGITISHDGKPDCGCGCACSEKLDVLIAAIERRIGQPLRQDSASALESPGRASEWIRSILPPSVVPQPAGLDAKEQVPSDQEWAEDTESVPLSPEADDGAPGGSADAGSDDDPQSMFASGVLAPAPPLSGKGCCSSDAAAAETQSCSEPSAAERSLAAAECCSTAEPGHPQQVLPYKSCCDGKDPSPAKSSDPATSKEKEKMSSCCCSAPQSGEGKRQSVAGKSGSGSSCSCCKKRKRQWEPGDPENPELDADGALSCSCGCHKPFEECTDCFEDLCEGVLLNPST